MLFNENNMNLLEITQEAINQFDMYRYPDLDDWKEQIDKVLSELGECTIGNDKIELEQLAKLMSKYGTK